MTDHRAQGETPDRLSRLLAELAAPQTLPGVATWEAPLRPGERVDRFEIRAELGRGGFGAVYEAWDAELGRAVALKTLRVSRARSEGSAGSIKQEAEAVARLNHPGIVTLHDVCHGPRGYYLVMERLEGSTLARRLRDGPLPWGDAVRLASEMADALGHAHRRGVLHRDLKPANVFVCEDGRAKVLDFGLAHLLGTSGPSSGGTPAYMAPEQMRGDVVDARADVFALGVVLVEMLSGELPFSRGETRGLAEGDPLPAMPRVPRRLARLIRRTLAREPSERPADGAALAAELSAFRRSMERRRWRAWIAATVAVGIVAAAGGLSMRPKPLPAGRLVTALADFDNRTNDASLDGIGGLLGAALEQSRRVALLDRGTLARVLTRGGVTPRVIGEAEAVSAARSAAAQLVLVPSLRPAPGGFELAVQVIDVARDRAIFSTREKAAAAETLYGAIDRVVLRVREALAERPDEAPRSPVPVASFAPADAEALRLYTEGERLNADYDYEGARAKWEAALERDPSFPLPRLALLQGRLGVFTYVELDEQAVRVHARALRRNLARLPEALRPWAETVVLRVDAGYANHTEYVSALDAAIAARPEQPAPYVAAANELLLKRGDAEAARPYVDRAVQLSPLAGLGDVIDYLVLTQRLDEALEQAQQWAEKAPAPISFLNVAMVHAARGDAQQAIAIGRETARRWGGDHVRPQDYFDALALDELDRSLERWPDPLLLAAAGRVGEALRVLDRWQASAPDLPYSVRDVPKLRATVLLVRGDREAARRFVIDAMSTSGPESIFAWQLAEAGDLRLARSLARAGDGLLAQRMVRAIQDWHAGDREEALAELAAIASPPSHFYSGEVLAELGRHEEAVDAYRRYRRLRHAQFSTGAHFIGDYFLPQSFYLEAISLEALGQRAEAHEVVSRLLRLWSKADADLPLLAQARALEVRLRPR